MYLLSHNFRPKAQTRYVMVYDVRPFVYHRTGCIVVKKEREGKDGSRQVAS